MNRNRQAAPGNEMKRLLWLLIVWTALAGARFSMAQTSTENSAASYRSELNVTYCQVDGKDLRLNAFMPTNVAGPAPAIVEIHGGWWSGGDFASSLEGVGGHQAFIRHGLAVFSIQYRLGKDGGFTENIRDCRNAIRFIRQNSQRFNIDPARIDVTGGSAGGHLSLMVAMVPDDFDDGGPTAGLDGISARVSGSFSYIPPTDFLRFWDQGPNDVITNEAGQTSFRGPDAKIPYDSRPRLRVLFHGITPDTEEHRVLYNRMSPVGHVNADVPPLLICDGEKDPIVPGLHGKALYEQLKAVNADAIYWMTPNGGHAFPGGPGFEQVLDKFLEHSLHLESVPSGEATK
jgi:acetyl esterase/lipase